MNKAQYSRLSWDTGERQKAYLQTLTSIHQASRSVILKHFGLPSLRSSWSPLQHLRSRKITFLPHRGDAYADELFRRELTSREATPPIPGAHQDMHAWLFIEDFTRFRVAYESEEYIILELRDVDYSTIRNPEYQRYRIPRTLLHMPLMTILRNLRQDCALLQHRVLLVEVAGAHEELKRLTLQQEALEKAIHYRESLKKHGPLGRLDAF